MNYGCYGGYTEEKQKCRKNENLMEPNAGAQKGNWNVHYPTTGCWSFFRLITKVAEYTPFILICSSPSPRPQQPQQSPRIWGPFPEVLGSAFPPLPPHPPWGLRPAVLCREGMGTAGGRALLGPSEGLRVSVSLPLQQGLQPLSQAPSGPLFSAGHAMATLL